MSRILLTQEKARLIASCYVGANYVKSAGLIKAGYSKSYATSGSGNSLYSNPLVIEAVRNIERASQTKTVVTVDLIQSRLVDLIERARAKNDLAAEARGLELLGKSIGAYSDRVEFGEQIQAKAIDATKRLEALRIAEIRLIASKQADNSDITEPKALPDLGQSLAIDTDMASKEGQNSIQISQEHDAISEATPVPPHDPPTP